ncbi:hypothetical protein [Bacillus sp. 165]|nr:hypothetical protein [Bacillus sp. 165]MBO9129077.1 hypothetical protein [Bacillus sp. 165]
MNSEQRNLILFELDKARRDYEYMHDDTRFYDGKIVALEEVCRILHIKNE